MEDEAGVLPSLAFSRAEVMKQPEGQRSTYVAAMSYHTAYVMGLMCALFLRQGVRLRAGALPGPAAAQAAAAAWARAEGDRLRVQGPRRQWLRDLAALDDAGLAAASGLVRDAALGRALRRLDFDDVRRLLRDTLQQGLAPSPLVAQSAAMLRRLVPLGTRVAQAGEEALAVAA